MQEDDAWYQEWPPQVTESNQKGPAIDVPKIQHAWWFENQPLLEKYANVNSETFKPSAIFGVNIKKELDLKPTT